MYCSKCGSRLANGVGFCSSCGAAAAASGQETSNQDAYTRRYKGLTEYFRILVDMETHIYMQRIVINMLDNKINSLGIRKDIPEPKLGEERDITILEVLLFSVGCFICGPLIWFAVGSIMAIFGGYLEISFRMIFKFMVGSAVVGFIFMLLAYISDKNIKQERYEQKYNEYVRQCREEDERLKREAWLKNMLNSEKRKIQKKREDSVQNLQMMYGKNICYGKYRNMVAVCSIFEYLESGRCYQLDGPNGCYNLFEQEVRANLIIQRLDVVISKLSQIQKNQNRLYWSINESNRLSQSMLESTDKMLSAVHTTNSRLNGISNNLGELNKQTAIETYNTERIARELEYLNRMELKTDKYKDITFYQR